MPSTVKDLEKAEHACIAGGSASLNMFVNLFRRIKLTEVEHGHIHDQTPAIPLSVYTEKTCTCIRHVQV